MNPQNNQKIFLSTWKIAKIFWLAQALSSLSFGIPLVAMTLFAANITFPIILKTILLYLLVSFFVFVPFHGILSFLYIQPIKKLFNKNYEKRETITKEELSLIGRIFNSPINLSVIVFISSFLGFVFGLSTLWWGVIPELIPMIKIIITLGLIVGFVTCLIQSSLVYIFMESYFRPKIEFLNRFCPDVIKKIKTRKFPIFWKVFFLALSSIVVAQASLGTLYLGRIIIYSPGDIKNALIYTSVVVILTFFYIVVIAFFTSKNLVYPIKKIIFWSDKIIKGKTKEEIFLTTNDEIAELIVYLKEMYEELEGTKSSLEIKIKARTKELQNLTEQQEEIIRERVKEIQKRTEELEKFQKLAVGRELKMIELKKEIKKLKNQL